jgi:hypothetical protein
VSENVIQMTETDATEEALRLLVRKLRRMQPQAFAAVMAAMPMGARDTLALAEMRADDRFLTAQREGVTRTWPSVYEETEDNED